MLILRINDNFFLIFYILYIYNMQGPEYAITFYSPPEIFSRFWPISVKSPNQFYPDQNTFLHLHKK